jgi:hypothetical protein
MMRIDRVCSWGSLARRGEEGKKIWGKKWLAEKLMAEIYRTDAGTVATEFMFLPSIFLPRKTNPERSDNSNRQQFVVVANPDVYRVPFAASLNPLSVHQSESAIDSG